MTAKNNYDRADSNLIIMRYDYLLRTKMPDYYRVRLCGDLFKCRLQAAGFFDVGCTTGDKIIHDICPHEKEVPGYHFVYYFL